MTLNNLSRMNRIFVHVDKCVGFWGPSGRGLTDSLSWLGLALHPTGNLSKTSHIMHTGDLWLWKSDFHPRRIMNFEVWLCYMDMEVIWLSLWSAGWLASRWVSTRRRHSVCGLVEWIEECRLNFYWVPDQPRSLHVELKHFIIHVKCSTRKYVLIYLHEEEERMSKSDVRTWCVCNQPNRKVHVSS